MLTLIMEPATNQTSHPRSRAGFTTGLLFGSILNPINSSIAAVALTSIAVDFGTTVDHVTWVVSGLCIATAVGQPTLGQLADRWGPRRVYLIGLTLVGLGGVIGWLSPNVPILVIARIVIGFGTSAAYPAALVILQRAHRDPASVKPPAATVAWLTIAGQVTLAIGPTIGGELISLAGWRLVLLVNLPLAIIGAAAVLLFLPRDAAVDRATSTEGRSDPLGILLFAAILTFLVFAFSGGAATEMLLALAGLVAATAGFVFWELRTCHPFINLRDLFRNRPLSFTYLRHAAVFAVHYSFMYGWPIWLEQSGGRSPGFAGLLLLPSFVTAAVAARIAVQIGLQRVPLILGSAGALAGCVCLALTTTDSPLWFLILTSVLFGLPEGLISVGNQFAVARFADRQRIGAASGMLRTGMYLGAIVSGPLVAISASHAPIPDSSIHILGWITVPIALLVTVSYLCSRSLRSVRNEFY